MTAIGAKTFQQQTKVNPNLDGPMCGASALRPSIQYHLESQIKQHRDHAFRLETLLRELPQMSHEAERALWDMMTANR